ncbi:MAG: TldD/PmbA family protein [Candidatus Cloacimonetes bacterium]|nr:TldD/PmbA family protein [Candidatus Cloacimonadota bacterium]
MIAKKVLERVLDAALSNGADFAEIFAENTFSSSITFNDSKTKQNIMGTDYGAGIRVFYGTTVIYAYTSDLSEKSLLKAAKAVAQAGNGAIQDRVIDLTSIKVPRMHPVKIPNISVDKQEKIDFLRKINTASRRVSDAITQVVLHLAEKSQHVLIANSEGLLVEDDRNYTRIAVSSIASSGTEKQTGFFSPGVHGGYEFIRSLDAEQLGVSTANSALTMLKADYAPSGKLPVVIDNGFGGVIFHEACGHALETTSVAKKASIFADKMGQKIASDVVTAIDDGTIPNAWGSTNIDDEGMPTQKTILIEKGILKSYMVDKIGSLKTGYARTGSGRRQSYRYSPASRMRNTYIAPGKHTLDDMLRSVDYGIYAKEMGGGSVIPGTGNFNFAIAEGYMIRKGKIAEPVRGATLIGNGGDALMKISMVADTLAFGQGMCGSVSGSIPANVGQAAIKIDEIVVGGRKEEK